MGEPPKSEIKTLNKLKILGFTDLLKMVGVKKQESCLNSFIWIHKQAKQTTKAHAHV